MVQRDGQRRRRASTWCSSTRRPSAASPPTGSTCRPTSSTRSPATSAARQPSAAQARRRATGPRPRAGPARRSREIAAELVKLYAARHGHARATRSARTPRGSASSRTPSRTSETPDQLTHDRRGQGATWSAGARWTGWSAATSATARPRSPCAPRSRRCRTASRWPCSCRRRCSSQQHFDDVRRADARRSRSTSRRCRRFQTDKEAKRGRRRAAPTARSTSSSAPTGCSARDIRFKDLGLVVVDEEQRFGVEHKEQHEAAAHATSTCSTMSATPIPRTLEMALTGIREMSTHRHAAGGPAPDPHLRRRVRRAAGRRRRSAASCCARARCSTCTTGCSRSRRRPRGSRELVPEARVAVAHGQMDEHQLEQVDGRLLGEARSTCWSAPRSSSPGLDISNANTLIVERADTARPRRSCTSCAAGSAAAASGPTPTSSTRRRSRSPRRRTSGWRRSPQHTELGAGMHDRDEGPRDPRRRQPARRRAVRPHRRRRLRPLRPDGRRGGRRVQGRGAEAELAEVKIELPVDAHLPHDYIAERAAAAGGVQAARRGPRRRRRRRGSREELRRPLRRAARARCATLLVVARFRARARQAGIGEVTVRASTSGSRRSTCPSRASCVCSGCTPRASSRRRSSTILVPRPQHRGRRRAGRSPGWPCLNGPAV